MIEYNGNCCNGDDSGTTTTTRSNTNKALKTTRTATSIVCVKFVPENISFGPLITQLYAQHTRLQVTVPNGPFPLPDCFFLRKCHRMRLWENIRTVILERRGKVQVALHEVNHVELYF